MVDAWMVTGRITFNPRIESALETIKDEAINAKLWEEEFHKKDNECEELKEENKRLSALVEKMLCEKKGRKKRG